MPTATVSPPLKWDVFVAKRQGLTAAPHAAARASGLEARRIFGLVVMLTGTFVAVLDNFIVFVAIPSIRANLGASFGQAEFVIAVYTLTFAIGVITAQHHHSHKARNERVDIMHPFRKLREGGPMTPAQAAVILNENVVMHTPVLIKPIVGRELVFVCGFNLVTEPRRSRQVHLRRQDRRSHDLSPMARHRRRTQDREPGAPDRRRERTAAGAHNRIQAVSGSQDIQRSADRSERRQGA